MFLPKRIMHIPNNNVKKILFTAINNNNYDNIK